ncbi:MAG: PRC and DUF2382 domain-containing protein [Microlunatus sp.]|nr:PRC and DUF2382 domain-containing protein [Microlunatus sp.]
MTINTEQIRDLTGNVYTTDSDKVGGIGQIYLDDDSGVPSWVTVKTGLFGSSESFVPLEGARVDGNDVHVRFDKDRIKDAPRVDADGSITPEEEDRLYEYYGLSDDRSGRRTEGVQGTGVRDTDVRDTDVHGTGVRDTDVRDTDVHGTGARDTDMRDTDMRDTDMRDTDMRDTDVRDTDMRDTDVRDTDMRDTDDASMTRSEERVDVGTAHREAGKARLRKYVTSETVTETVPVSHEEATIEREPITESNRDTAHSGPAISEEEHEVVLHEEVPVVDKDTVAVEQVKLGKETVTEDATVSEEVRKENIEMVDSDTSDRRPDTSDLTSDRSDRR